MKPTTLEILRLRANILEENVSDVTQMQINTNTSVREDLQYYTEEIQSEQMFNKDLSKRFHVTIVAFCLKLSMIYRDTSKHGVWKIKNKIE